MEIVMSTELPIIIPSHVLSESLSGETVLLNISSGMYFGLSPVASRFWQLLREGVGRSDAQMKLLEEFDVEEEALQGDLDKLLAELEAKKLITRQAA